MGGMGFWQELKRRHVYRVAATYAIVGWLLIQIATQVFPFFKLPDWSVRLIVLAILIGFPIALVLAWAFDVTPVGGIRRVTADGQLVLHDRRHGMAVVAVIGVLVAALAGAGWWWRHQAVAVLQPESSVAKVAAPRPLARSPDAVRQNPAAKTAMRVVAIPAKSVAVLPFINESGNQDQQYFSDGLSEDLITALSQFAGLKVISRDSSFQFRNSKDASKIIGDKLGVAHLLEGSVQREGNEVRISATLVNAGDGSTLWSQHYDRPYKDLFALQDAITHDVANALKAKLMLAPGAVVQSDRPPNGNLDAYAAFLQGQSGMVLGDLCNSQVMTDFQRAIRLDPRYALAYVRVSQCWVGKYRVWHTAADGPQDIAQARTAIQTALTLDPDLAAAHVGHGFLLYSMDFDWYGAEAEYRRALQLAPDNVEAKAALADVLATLGHLQDAIALRRAVLKVDPRNVKAWLWLSSMFVSNGQLDDAARTTNKALALDPHIINSYVNLAVVGVLRGNARQAMAFARREPDPVWRHYGIALAAQIGPDHAQADAALQALIAHNADSAASLIADVYALRRDPDNTFKWLDRAWAQRDVGIEGLLTDNFILRYKNDPRFAALCKQAGLPDTTDAKAAP